MAADVQVISKVDALVSLEYFIRFTEEIGPPSSFLCSSESHTKDNHGHFLQEAYVSTSVDSWRITHPSSIGISSCDPLPPPRAK